MFACKKKEFIFFDKNWIKDRNNIESVIGIILLYIVFVAMIVNLSAFLQDYKPFTTDEFYYYLEAKNISQYNNYEAPASLDGNTSIIGNFGFHGISYAIVAGWLFKLFFMSENPPLVFINLLFYITSIFLMLFYKKISFNKRVLFSVMLATQYVLVSYTCTMMQETIHVLFAVVSLVFLHLLYSNDQTFKSKYLYYFLAIVLISITFRYIWFIWALAIIPLYYNSYNRSLKELLYILLIVFLCTAFGLFVNRFIMAPYPYGIIVDDFAVNKDFTHLISSVFQKLTNNIIEYLTYKERVPTLIMRYLLLISTIYLSYLSYLRKDKFLLSSTIVIWFYIKACLGFYEVIWDYDERVLCITYPIVYFGLIHAEKKYFRYAVLLIQILILPKILEEAKMRAISMIEKNNTIVNKEEINKTYQLMSKLNTENKRTVIMAPINFCFHNTYDYLVNFPLVNANNYPIHYTFFRTGQNILNKNKPDFLMDYNPQNIPNTTLVHSNQRMSFYKFQN